MGEDNNYRLIEILLVEDNPADVRLTKEALREGRILNRLNVVKDGMEALSFLRREGEHSSSPRPDLILLDLNLPRKDGREVLAEIKRPDLILLDLNLPRKDGREVLAEIKSDDEFKSIPVVVLTTSKAEEDILKSYKHHANCYITKPVDLDQFIGVTKSIEEFWLGIVQLPPKRTPNGRKTN